MIAERDVSAEHRSGAAPQLVTEGTLLIGMKLVNGWPMDRVAARESLACGTFYWEEDETDTARVSL